MRTASGRLSKPCGGEISTLIYTDTGTQIQECVWGLELMRNVCKRSYEERVGKSRHYAQPLALSMTVT